MSGKPNQGFPRELLSYMEKKSIRFVTADANVSDVTIGVVELAEMRIRLLKRLRVKRPIHLISFIRRVSRRSMKTYGRPASNWLTYLKARENQWINDSIHAIIKSVRDFGADAVIVEALDARSLRLKLKSRDPELSQRYSTWPVAKFLRRLERACEKRSIRLIKVPPQFSSHICPRCHSRMTNRGRRRVKCPRCGREDDRDHVAIVNLAKTAAVTLGLQYAPTPLRFILRDYERRFPAQGPLKALGSWEAKGETPQPPSPEPARGTLGWGVNEPFAEDLQPMPARGSGRQAGHPAPLDGK